MSDRKFKKGSGKDYSRNSEKARPERPRPKKHHEKRADHDRGRQFKTANESSEDENLVIKGRHEVLGSLEAGQRLEAIFISAALRGPVLAKVREMASAAGVPVKEMNAEVFARKFGEKSQGIAATAGAFAYSDLEELVEVALAGSQVIVALNQVEDPRNLGAIVRTVEAAGCAGIIIAKHRSAGMTEWAIRTAQGAAAHLPVARVTNIADAIGKLKEEGFWVVGLDGAAEKIFTAAVYNGPILLVAGGEDAGLGERVKKCCDELVAIPLCGKTSSLNVSVSTAVVLFEICRQKDFFQKL